MNEATIIIEQEVQALRCRREECVQEAARLDVQIEALCRVNARIRQEQSTDSEDREDENEEQEEESPVPLSPNGLFSHRLKPSEAVRAYLREHPGSTRKTIIRTVSQQSLDSTSKNPKRLLDSTLRQLVTSGHVIEREDQFFLTEDRSEN